MHEEPFPEDHDRADAIANADATGLIANQATLVDFEMLPVEANAEPLPEPPDGTPG